MLSQNVTAKIVVISFFLSMEIKCKTLSKHHQIYLNFRCCAPRGTLSYNQKQSYFSFFKFVFSENRKSYSMVE